ncbi:HEPN domain-containing protein [Candidatus Bathyarchaeota archaeon]|nr:HEPN domain-containing protein [Candidatus Bathyarchaeota archaeon]
MKKSSFLSKLKKEGKLELVEPSEEICASYLEKADNCLKSAKLLLENNLYENSISMSYYVMYNSLTALLFKTGIKCENHTGSILLFKKLFGKIDLFKAISFAKKERIDKQYYVDFTVTKMSARDLLKNAEDFLVKIKLLIKNLNTEEIEKLREKFLLVIK